MTIVDIENQISLTEIIKGVLPSELERFTREYISNNKFIKSSSNNSTNLDKINLELLFYSELQKVIISYRIY